MKRTFQLLLLRSTYTYLGTPCTHSAALEGLGYKSLVRSFRVEAERKSLNTLDDGRSGVPHRWALSAGLNAALAAFLILFFLLGRTDVCTAKLM